MSELVINSPFLQALALTLLHFLWQGVVVASLLKLLLSLISTKRANLRYGITSLAMIASLAAPIVTFSYLYQPIAKQFHSVSHSIPISQFQQALQQVSGSSWYQPLVEFLPYISIVWLIWVAFLTTKLVIEIITVRKLPHQHTIATDGKLATRFAELAKQIGLTHTPRLVISLKAQVPMAIGWLKPVVLMPAQMLMGLTQEQLEMLLLHELAHIRRYDYLVNFLQTLIEILLFFHPAVIWISKQMRQEREYCADDTAVAHCGNSVAYAHTLADTASLCSKHRHATIPTMAMAASGGDLKARVVRLVNHSCTNSQEPGRLLAGLTILSVALLIAAKQMISAPAFSAAWFNGTWLELTNIGINTPHKNQHFSPAIEPTLANDSIAQQLLAPELIRPKQQALTHSVETNTNTVKTNTPPVVTNINAKPALAKQLMSKQTQATPSTKVALVRQEREMAPSLATKQYKSASAAPLQETLTTTDLHAAPSKAEQLLSEAKQSKNPYQQTLTQLNEPQPSSHTEKRLFTEESSNTKTNELLTTSNTDLPAIAKVQSDVSLFEQRYQSTSRQALEIAAQKQPAKLMATVEPRYPSVARRKGIELDVLVNFTIDKNGQVTDIEFERQGKLGYFRSSIISAMKQWQFEPARINGEPVSSNMSKIFSFNMN